MGFSRVSGRTMTMPYFSFQRLDISDVFRLVMSVVSDKRLVMLSVSDQRPVMPCVSDQRLIMFGD